ncbi:hypothetical protein AB1L88_22210 [Tautonia sp. JC769]|uniref:hypothetical protein n=1 Tax=Tautonia sp. JC769 TaxID=3232135 RepID=UPI00345B1841
MMGGELDETSEWIEENTMATQPDLEARVAAIEDDLKQLKQSLGQATSKAPWWESIVGTFENDPHFEEAMRLGREYRESLRPKPRARRR